MIVEYRCKCDKRECKLTVKSLHPDDIKPLYCPYNVERAYWIRGGKR